VPEKNKMGKKKKRKKKRGKKLLLFPHLRGKRGGDDPHTIRGGGRGQMEVTKGRRKGRKKELFFLIAGKERKEVLYFATENRPRRGKGEEGNGSFFWGGGFFLADVRGEKKGTPTFVRGGRVYISIKGKKNSTREGVADGGEKEKKKRSMSSPSGEKGERGEGGAPPRPIRGGEGSKESPQGKKKKGNVAIT